MNYTHELTKAMTMLAQDSRTVFVGQSVRYDGQRMHHTLDGVPMAQRIEFPVIEDFQMGYCLGMALEGFVPISLYPRWDFLLLAANQLVNHLDKVPNGFHPKVMIRVAVGSTSPLNPGPQHCQNYTRAFRGMLWNVVVVDLIRAEVVREGYADALKADHSTILVEHMSLYDH